MKLFPSNADTLRSQCPEQEEHIYLKLDKDNKVQDTVEEPIAVVKILSEIELRPWIHIKEYFKFKSKKDLTLSFQCQLCISATKVVLCTMKSCNGLKSHFQRAHSFDFNHSRNVWKKKSKKSRKGPERKNFHLLFWTTRQAAKNNTFKTNFG